VVSVLALLAILKSIHQAPGKTVLPSSSAGQTIAVVGAGFAGIATACNLMRLAGEVDANIKVVLIGNPKSFGGGLAYRVEDDNLILNVPVGNMSLYLDRPNDFLEFCNEIDGAWVSGSFVSRRLYGQYLESCVALARDGSKAELVEMRHEVRDIVPVADGFRIEFQSHPPLRADRVVLALGHLPSVALRHLEPSPGGDGLATARVIDAWDGCAIHRLPAELPVLVVGTGHTAVDTVFRLASAAPERKIFMLSRHGRLPAGHRKADEFVRLPKLKDSVETDVRAMLRSTPTARALFSRLRELAAAHLADGGDWRDVINSLRSITPEIWSSLALKERARFRRHLLSLWDPVRHRLAPVAARRLARLIESGRAEVLAGRLQSLESIEGATKWSITFMPRGRTQTSNLQVGAIIDCTGSNYDVTKTDHPLIRNLLNSGLLRPDQDRLGLEVDAEYRCCQLSNLYYVGPMLRSQYWESTAVPELRKHASMLAALLLDIECDHGDGARRSRAVNQKEVAT
jgi:uncharacterized NAD(P)/FAD-binding protein YdhS